MMKVFKQRKTGLIPFVYEYFLSIPPDYNKDNNKNWPFLLFLHGAGESHPPIDKVLNHGPPKLVHSYLTCTQDTQPLAGLNLECSKLIAENFITCSPQVNEGYGWNDQVLINLIDQIEQDYRIDKNRVYCTGISMGGYGCWSLAMAQPNRFAAIIPICGGGDEKQVTCLKHLPIWNFHGKLDDVVPVEESTNLIKTLNSELCKSTIYPNLEHDSWTETYNNKDIYTWLLQHTKSH
ncbi:unnamed protein product [Adineta steineri]|uniref:Phospholipase/carboxylesterase/thioesterase domain-containing protein n=2 Tax=Adineta steineri TaxID=433720 RepID=A0A819FZI7_9BILA|nr:unnamed protein product [Adineta steineri]CAF1264940.1 unnamed protein product [Adineta steineri]CAF3680232.1 unnamed protein product [Adineta steineri]CAF3877163.1 unnamed protein product [Adineta steineri]